MGYFETDRLCVGYDGKVLIEDISISIERGKILTLIGPNGAGKSTILKSITNHLKTLGGKVIIAGDDITGWSSRRLARQVAVVLTDRIRPELMTCAQVVAMGRYPYTNMLGRLTSEDREKVRQALIRVHALDLADRDFLTLSDGQRQRILLARAICQQPEIIVLDEPTAYLDIRHKIELLDILRDMARNQNITVIMSLHEIDLATKISDCLICVKGKRIADFGPPEKILREDTIGKLYDLDKGSYNLLYGSVELAKPKGRPQVFVVGGGGRGIPVYRALQKQGRAFAAGILFENDVDFQVAKELSDHVVAAPAFEPVSEECMLRAEETLLSCTLVVDAGTPIGSWNACNGRLLQLAAEQRIPVVNPESLYER